MKLFSLTLVLLAGFASAQTIPITSIRHVTVIDVSSGAKLADQTVTVQGDRISSIAPTKDSDNTAGSLDGTGAFLIPGLWDMHVHVHDKDELPLYVANGVTGIRIMSGEKDTAALRRALASQTPSPEIYLASAIVDGDPPVWPGSIVVKKAVDARRAVDDIKASGADFVKVYSRLSRDAYFVIADEAKKQHIPFEGHVPDTVTAQEAATAGQRSIEHLTGLPLACSSQQDRLMSDLARAQYFRDRLFIEGEAYRTVDQRKCHILADMFRNWETWQVPTLTVLRVWGSLDDAKYLNDPRLAYIDRRFRDRWSERLQPQMRRWNYQMYEAARGIFRADEEMVGFLFRNRVPIMAGTDAMNPYCFPGFSLHDELALMVESGMTPLAVLQAATINPATFMGKTADEGTVEPGKFADLVLLAADPLADIHNTTKIQAVWLKGKYFDKASLNDLLEKAKAGARH